jgi:hypothetical protein
MDFVAKIGTVSAGDVKRRATQRADNLDKVQSKLGTRSVLRKTVRLPKAEADFASICIIFP